MPDNTPLRLNAVQPHYQQQTKKRLTEIFPVSRFTLSVNCYLLLSHQPKAASRLAPLLVSFQTRGRAQTLTKLYQ